jgi:hypothetical protein
MVARNANTEAERKAGEFTRDKRADGISRSLGGRPGKLSDRQFNETESDMQTADTVGRDQDYAEFDSMEESVMSEQHLHAVEQTLSRLQGLSDGMVDEEKALAIVARELAEMGYQAEEVESIMSAVDEELNGFDQSAFDMMEPDGSYDMSDDADALASAGHGSDEDYGDFGGEEFEEDIQNGYDDIESMDGDDFFPNGADGPVVTAVGPSGARQGDNPEQKKMQVAETHKELVYAYRNFLKESVHQKKR